MQDLLKDCKPVSVLFGKTNVPWCIQYSQGPFLLRLPSAGPAGNKEFVMPFKDSSPFLISHIPLVEAVGKTLGVGEVILYDFEQDPPVLIAREGGITNRPPGTRASQLLCDMVREMEEKSENMRVNYESATTSGKPLKSTTLLLRHENRVAGALCLNIDMSAMNMLQHFLDQFSGKERLSGHDDMPQNTQEFLNIMIGKGIESIGKPVCYFDKKDNIEVVRFLNESNIFSIKGSTDTLAGELNVSRYTIYNYIEEVKNTP